MQDNCIDCGKQFYSRNGEGYCYACSIKDLINPQVNAIPIKEVTELDALVHWAEATEQEFMMRYRVSVDLLKVIVEEFRNK